MRYLLVILLFPMVAVSQTCDTSFTGKLLPSDTLVNSCSNPLVVMSVESYVGFYYDQKKLKDLKNALPEYKGKIDSIIHLKDKQLEDLDSLNAIKEQIIEIERLNKKECIKALRITEHNYIVQRKKVKKYKFQRNGLIGTTVALLTLIIIK